jgi:hypothetical protein
LRVLPMYIVSYPGSRPPPTDSRAVCSGHQARLRDRRGWPSHARMAGECACGTSRMLNGALGCPCTPLGAHGALARGFRMQGSAHAEFGECACTGRVLAQFMLPTSDGVHRPPALYLPQVGTMRTPLMPIPRQKSRRALQLANAEAIGGFTAPGSWRTKLSCRVCGCNSSIVYAWPTRRSPRRNTVPTACDALCNIHIPPASDPTGECSQRLPSTVTSARGTPPARRPLGDASREPPYETA